MTRAVLYLGLTILSPFSLFSGEAKLNVVGGMKIDFGDVYTGLTVKRLVTLKNDGTDTLIISNVSSSCGCTGTLLTHDHIAPNDSGVLEITFNTKKFSGKVDKSISMYTNDSTQSYIHIYFTANVLTLLTFEPEYFYFQTTADSATTQTMSITNTGSQAVRILSVKPTSELFSAKVSEDKIDPGKRATLVSVLKAKYAGTFFGNIEITTDNPNIPLLSLRVAALVKETASTSSTKHN